ncbi:regulatory protein ArsR [Desulfurobacterium thermolithotrophum DSM 11699]|uniref:Regulatory protein ArsR n=1 Tax=Desulfurobacterium thermolithotrophum (strain DSM 11699 / BSA) TaxID=868864 RepID=F0S333_DESTD|nr:ArsR family transcriptional regulator [Desulfurobacterium thermolithotrophum]ADY73255.1 regulatory protein ArsR [Desulfurobacterium thermolithotrophum DSM 11699]
MDNKCGKHYKKYTEYAKRFEILSNPIRIGIIVALADGPKKPKEIRALLGVPQPLLSQHASVLKEMGIIERVDKFNVKSPCQLKDKTILDILKAAGIKV